MNYKITRNDYNPAYYMVREGEDDEAAKAAAAKDAADKAAADAAAADETPIPDGDLSLENTPKVETPQVTVQETGNAKLDSIGKLLASKNIENAQGIMDEFSRDGTLSVASQATLVEKLGDSVAAMVIRNLDETATALKAEAKTRREELLDYTNKKFNGEDANLTWSQVSEFANSPEANLSSADKQHMNSLLAKGGLSAQLVIDKLASIYYNLPSTSTPADLLEADTYNSAGFKPISKREYTEELRKAVDNYGYDSRQAKELRTRREQSRQRGY